MEQQDLKALAQQLACPEGEAGAALGARMNELNAFITERSIQALNPTASECILEIGFGNGELSLPIIEAIGESGRFIGVETSAVLAQQAARRLGGRANVSIIPGDCHAADIEHASLDGVLAVNVLYFIDDIAGLFRRIHDWLKPGGRMVMGVRSAESLRAMPFTAFAFKIRTLEAMESAMQAGGFVDVAADYFDEGVVEFGELRLPMDTLVIQARKP